MKIYKCSGCAVGEAMFKVDNKDLCSVCADGVAPKGRKYRALLHYVRSDGRASVMESKILTMAAAAQVVTYHRMFDREAWVHAIETANEERAA